MMDFSLPAGNSRRRRRLKKPGAGVPGFTGVWGRSATNKRAPGKYRGIACRYNKTTNTALVTFALKLRMYWVYDACFISMKSFFQKGLTPVQKRDTVKMTSKNHFHHLMKYAADRPETI